MLVVVVFSGVERAIEIQRESVEACIEEPKTREEGIISTWNASYGFIKCAEREGRVFFHIQDVREPPFYENLRPGMHVSFCYIMEVRIRLDGTVSEFGIS